MHYHNVPQQSYAHPLTRISTLVSTEIETQTETSTVFLDASPAPTSVDTPPPLALNHELPLTSIISHAPGWTLFRNLYMSNGTLYILSSNRSFPEIRLMTSTGLPAQNTPENIAAREPTTQNMDFITPEQARDRWGAGEKHRVLSVEGNTASPPSNSIDSLTYNTIQLLFNDPSQFLRHYYHFVAELFLGTWAFWHGAFSTPSSNPTSAFGLTHPPPPPIHRAIFAHSNADGWRDDPGFNAYFLRAAFPSLTVEVQEDWADRIAVTTPAHPNKEKEKDRAWHFPLVLLADRSAAHRGAVCGSQTQRTASEAWEAMRRADQLMGHRVGGWWEPLRKAVWEFAGVPRGVVTGDSMPALAMPEKVVITYISRQGVSRRKLKGKDHEGLVAALEALVARKGDGWELVVLQAEKLTKDEQVRAAARTTILLGVHGNGLTHLVFMKPTRASAVIELFYPGGFAHDYHWTSRALGMDHYAVWDDKSYTYPDEPPVNYPEPGFQGNEIPVSGPAVARLIEEHVERKRTAV
ncbi:hypothetical protein D9615_007992 [Tricholomella constricta]|uniref:Glycosyltransferase 61 catalytic domain-containing protein n=1 Tax=Tricholomella constricta TaxID=117010 RepID=A0A8H5H1V5_9AGAR|nr:hypothetical protein D9615_007992 [Tricholomella constricta]